MQLLGPTPKRIALFQEIQSDLQNESESDSDDYKILRLKSLSMTRWTTRTKAVKVVLEKIVEQRTTLDILLKDKTVQTETRARIKGLLPQLSSLKAVSAAGNV